MNTVHDDNWHRPRIHIRTNTATRCHELAFCIWQAIAKRFWIARPQKRGSQIWKYLCALPSNYSRNWYASWCPSCKYQHQVKIKTTWDLKSGENRQGDPLPTVYVPTESRSLVTFTQIFFPINQLIILKGKINYLIKIVLPFRICYDGSCLEFAVWNWEKGYIDPRGFELENKNKKNQNLGWTSYLLFFVFFWGNLRRVLLYFSNNDDRYYFWWGQGKNPTRKLHAYFLLLLCHQSWIEFNSWSSWTTHIVKHWPTF